MRLAILRVMLCKRFARVPVALSDQSKGIEKDNGSPAQEGKGSNQPLGNPFGKRPRPLRRCYRYADRDARRRRRHHDRGSGSITWYGMFPQLNIVKDPSPNLVAGKSAVHHGKPSSALTKRHEPDASGKCPR